MKVIITGSSGMVGKATLIECIESKHVEKILVVNRTSINLQDEKLKEILYADFNDFTNIQENLIKILAMKDISLPVVSFYFFTQLGRVNSPFAYFSGYTTALVPSSYH